MNTSTTTSWNSAYASNPFFIGWERVFDRMNDITSLNANTFPPYNVRKDGEDRFIVELAVAGYNKHDMKIYEDNGNLIIEGDKPESSSEYLYKGITSKKFKRSFSLGEHVHVEQAHIADGILLIALKREIPDELKPREIKIENFSGKKEK